MNIRNRRSIRLHGYDYSQNGAYFITICTKDRVCLFGEVINAEMILNEYGKLAENIWYNTQEIRDNVQLDVFVVMPNHLHAIVVIDNGRGVLHTPTSQEGVCNTPLRSPSNNLGAIVRGYKSAVTKWFRQNTKIQNVWQGNYYEHIIRDRDDYDHISNYIQDNPINWSSDALYS